MSDSYFLDQELSMKSFSLSEEKVKEIIDLTNEEVEYIKEVSRSQSN